MDQSASFVGHGQSIEGGNFGFHNTSITPLSSCYYRKITATELQLITSLLQKYSSAFPFNHSVFFTRIFNLFYFISTIISV
jgi:hypothetical protein